MTSAVEVLERDSELVGVVVARAVLSGATPEVLADLDEAGRAAGARLLVGDLDPERSDAIVLVQEHGWRLAEITITLRRPAASPLGPRPGADGVAVRTGTAADVDALDALVDPLLRWRGATHDARLGPEVARRQLARELLDAAEGVDGARLLVAEDATGPVGMAVLHAEGGPRLSLLSVRLPGSGVSDAVVARALEEVDGDLAFGPCAAGDLHGLRCAERMGCLMTSSRYQYLRWLDPDPGP